MQASQTSGVDGTDVLERRYGIAGRAAGEAALEHGRDGARIRSCLDAFVLSRIARAVVDALADDERGAVDTLRERVMALGGMRRTDQGAFWIDRDDVLRLLDEIGERP